MLNLSCLGLKNCETRKYDAISKTAYRKTGHRIVANLVITLNKYIHILSFYFQLVIPSKKEVSTTVDWDKILTISSVKKKKSCFEWQTTPHNSSLHIEENFRSPHAYALTKTKKGEKKKIFRDLLSHTSHNHPFLPSFSMNTYSQKERKKKDNSFSITFHPRS